MIPKEKILEVVSLIPRGKVVTYGSLAKLSGIKSPRVVGNILHKNLDPEKTPCHRVVNRQGAVAINFAFGGAKEQIKKLENEGVAFADGRVDLLKHLWNQRMPVGNKI